MSGFLNMRGNRAGRTGQMMAQVCLLAEITGKPVYAIFHTVEFAKLQQRNVPVHLPVRCKSWEQLQERLSLNPDLDHLRIRGEDAPVYVDHHAREEPPPWLLDAR